MTGMSVFGPESIEGIKRRTTQDAGYYANLHNGTPDKTTHVRRVLQFSPTPPPVIEHKEPIRCGMYELNDTTNMGVTQSVSSATVFNRSSEMYGRIQDALDSLMSGNTCEMCTTTVEKNANLFTGHACKAVKMNAKKRNFSSQVNTPYIRYMLGLPNNYLETLPKEDESVNLCWNRNVLRRAIVNVNDTGGVNGFLVYSVIPIGVSALVTDDDCANYRWQDVSPHAECGFVNAEKVKIEIVCAEKGARVGKLLIQYVLDTVSLRHGVAKVYLQSLRITAALTQNDCIRFTDALNATNAFVPWDVAAKNNVSYSLENLYRSIGFVPEPAAGENDETGYTMVCAATPPPPPLLQQYHLYVKNDPIVEIGSERGVSP